MQNGKTSGVSFVKKLTEELAVLDDPTLVYLLPEYQVVWQNSESFGDLSAAVVKAVDVTAPTLSKVAYSSYISLYDDAKITAETNKEIHEFRGSLLNIMPRQIMENHGKGVRPLAVFSMCADSERMLNIVADVIRSVSVRDTITVMESEKILQSILNNINSIIYVIDMQSNEVLFLNENALEAFGNVAAQKCYSSFVIGAGEPCPDCILASCDINAPAKTSEVYNEKTGRWFSTTVKVIKWTDGREAHLVSAIDINDKREQADMLGRLAFYNMLTGLPNRSKAVEDIEESIKSGKLGSVVLANIDNFKIFNEAFGHSSGDKLICAIADYFKHHAMFENRAYSFTGDEFLIHLEGFNSNDALNVINKLFERFNSPWQIEHREHYFTVSIGCATYPDDGNAAETVITNAEVALYKAKDTTSNTYIQYKRVHDAALIDRIELVELERALHKAVREKFDQFDVFYLPTQDLATQSFVGAEALLRWNHPDKGTISPMRVIPIAEFTGLIVPLGAFVLKTACIQCKAWQVMGIPDFRISINLSRVQMFRDDLVDTVKEALELSGLEAKYLDIEITEELVDKDVNLMVKRLNDLRAIGVSIVLDDFGTGRSSLNSSKNLPVDLVKIDRALSNFNDEYTVQFLSSVIGLVRSRGIRVCAEGIESSEQLETVKALGSNLAQGFYLGMPMDAESLTALLFS